MGIDFKRIYQLSMFLAENFECIICKELVDQPRVCETCNNHFCFNCI